MRDGCHGKLQPIFYLVTNTAMTTDYQIDVKLTEATT